jgi:hypothetical protein
VENFKRKRDSIKKPESQPSIVSCYTADSNPVKQEGNGTGMLPHLVFPGQAIIDATGNTNRRGRLSKVDLIGL